ncbi:MAG: NAD(+)/NADH kinase [Rubricoccaceae bacterium]|nr:NAD(+)/NADH kinase [Rubricoccaceae bacterium]
MTYGILGNTGMETIWEPVVSLAQWMDEQGLSYLIDESVCEGLVERSLLDEGTCAAHRSERIAEESDILLSFGGDGTLLQAAHLGGVHETPILGVNLGRLGFLTKIEVQELQEAILRIEDGAYTLAKRMAIAMEIPGTPPDFPNWALNDVVIAKTGSASMMTVEAEVDGAYLNTYRADGLIVATPTGSTAYSLSADGPIIVPGSQVMILTPIAPHTLTARPIVLPDSVQITLRVVTPSPYLVASDGRSMVVEELDLEITIRRARHIVQLVTFPDRDYFSLLRSKLKWGEEREE